MRIIPLLLLCACSSEPAPAPAPVQDDPVVAKLKAGEAPEELVKDKDGKYAAEVALAIRDRREWKTPADRDRAMQYFVAVAKKGYADELFLVMEREKAPTAWGAIVVLSSQLTADHLPRLEGYLTGKDDALAGRAILLLGEARFGGVLLEKHAAALFARKGMAKPVLHAIGQCRARGATKAILDYYEKSDDEACLKALGRCWEQRLDAKPLAKEDEQTRLLVYVLLHRYAMGALSTKENVDAMLRVMTAAELDDFLAKHARAAFVSRKLVADAAGMRAFEKAKGGKIHAALLANPDAMLVATILYTSPHKLDAKPLLARTDEVEGGTWPKGTRVCDLAAVRLARQAGEEADVPATAEGRAKLVERFK